MDDFVSVVFAGSITIVMLALGCIMQALPILIGFWLIGAIFGGC